MKIELALKFGSNEIILYRKGMGIVVRKPSYVATARSNGKICAYGAEAKRLYELKGGQYELNEPIKGVEIVNPKLATALLDNIFKEASIVGGGITVIVAVPCALGEKKLLELKQVLHNIGINKVTFVQNAVCVRNNLNLKENLPVMVVDMGKYLIDLSVLTKYEFIKGRNYLIGGNLMDEALMTYIQDNYEVQIDLESAENIKNEIASMYSNDMYTTTFKGINANDEYKEVTMRANEARVAIIGVYDKIFDLIDEFLEELPSEILAQVRENGVVFTGGVSSIEGLVEYVSKRLNMPLSVVDNPKDAVILGAGKLLSLNKGEYPYIKL